MSFPVISPRPDHARSLRYLFLMLLLCLGGTTDTHAALSKGHRILIEKGLQVQGLCIDDNFVTLSTYSNANYTSFCWLNEYTDDGSGQMQPTHSSRPDWMGTPPGVLPWARWVRHETLMAPHMTPYGGDETPFMPQLMAMQLGDEWNLNDDTVRDRLVNWFTSVRSNWPNTILYHNSWGSQVLDAQLADFYTRAQPDLLSFDTYPWRSVWDSNEPDHIGAPMAGPPVGWYGDLRRYREHGRAAGIPVGIYRQTFHAVQDYDNTVYRDPSHSELRLNTSAALAFNVKYFMDYTYNTGANSMFERQCNWCGDTQIKSNGIYTELADVNKRAVNFGKALVRLMPITNERLPGYTTSMMFIRGKDGNGNYNPLPVGFVTSGAEGHSSWVAGHNDLFLTSWEVQNTGTVNNGQPGDVIVSWFKPLDETFDGPDYTNEIYMMVVNGLTHTSGTAADCSQKVTLNFHRAVGALEVVNPTTGRAELKMLPVVNGLRQLVLDLNGGDAALFKFASAAPFLGTQKELVFPGPIITLHPISREAGLGTRTTFTVKVHGGEPFYYQWQFNGDNIPGATASTFTRENVKFSDAGTYRVVVSNSFESVSSSEAELAVISAEPFFYEPFDYTNIGSPVSSNNPANWTYGGTGTNDLHVASGSLSYPGLTPSIGNSATNGGVGLGVRRLLGTNVNSGELYFSALFRINQLGYPTWNGAATQVAALCAPDNTNFRLAILVKSNSPSGYVFGVQKAGTGVTPTFDTVERHANETVLLVGKYDFTVSPNTVSLWINPGASTFGAVTPPGSGFITASTGTDGPTIDRINIRQNTGASVPAAMQWDEFRAGTRWTDVTPLATPTAVTLTNVSRLPNGTTQFSYSSDGGKIGSVYGSTNLTDWTYLGAPSEVSAGTYQFNDAAGTNETRRFYQLRWP